MISINYNYLNIEYSSVSLDFFYTFKFKLRNNSFTPKWIKKVIQAQQLNYPIDEPGRFYGFNSYEVEEKDAISRVNRCIDIINSHSNLIHKYLSSVNEQDFLNELHFLFEQYHGLLDKQLNKEFLSASDKVKKAFADLNINIHRCESVRRLFIPRHVVTYYGLPKEDLLDIDDYNLFTDEYKFGTVYLNYVEIGKTLEDLALDHDIHLYDQEFQPYRHYSADFCVIFENFNENVINDRRKAINDYYLKNKWFFQQRNLPFDHYLLRPGRIPLADLVVDKPNSDVLELIRQRQFVNKVYFS